MKMVGIGSNVDVDVNGVGGSTTSGGGHASFPPSIGIGGSSAKGQHHVSFPASVDQASSNGVAGGGGGSGSNGPLRTSVTGSRQSGGGRTLKSTHTNASRASAMAKRQDHRGKSRHSAIQWTRILFALSLLLLAGVLGFCVYYFFRQSEQQLALKQFDSIAGRATSYALETTRLKRLGVITMASVIGQTHSNANNWPYVYMAGYDEFAKRLVQTISGDGMGFAPLVEPGQLASFESYAYDYVYADKLGYPINTTAISSFGKGVWAKDLKGKYNVTAKDKKYHEGTIHPEGETTYGSPYNIFAPVLQHSAGQKANPLMLNLHYEKVRGQTIDNLITCSNSQKNSSSDQKVECGQISDLLLLTQRRVPAGLFMQPIYPALNSSTMVGLISSPMVWHDVLDNAFGEGVSGIHCVLTSSNNKTYTYYVEDGLVGLMEEPGDLHDSNFDEYQQSIVLTSKQGEDVLYSSYSASYTLRLYPSREFMRSYTTNNPLVGTVLSVLIVLGTTLLFYLYDSNVRGEFDFKNDLLEAKRAFIRFVSHEVRTPLNAVCMGLTLMREELEKAIRDSRDTIHSSTSTADLANTDHLNTRGQDTTTAVASESKEEGNNPQQQLPTTIAPLFSTSKTALPATTTPLFSTSMIAATPPPTASITPTTTPADSKLLNEWREVADEILGNAQNAVDVLTDLLNYDKISTGSFKLELGLLPTSCLLQHAQKEFKLPATKKQIDVVFDDRTNSTSSFAAAVPLNGLCLVGDDVRLVQVLRNLMSNALKFTPPKGKIRVELAYADELPDGYGSNNTKRRRRKRKENQQKEQEFTLRKGEQLSLNRCGYLRFSVTDTGAGMSPEQMENVFQQGTQFNVNELQAGQGSGLGLFIAKGIMDQHFGSLTVSSEGLGKGTTFAMTLPVYYDTRRNNLDGSASVTANGDPAMNNPYNFKASKSSSTSPQQIMNDGDHYCHPLRILVVDDSDTNRKFLTRLLQNHGHACDQAPNGSEAVKMVADSMNSVTANSGGTTSDEGSSDDPDCCCDNDQLYDAVLLDYEMPIMNGPTAAKEMRNLGCDTFIVGITGNLLPEDIDHFRAQGANEVLPKPFNISDLEEILMEYGVGVRSK